MVTLIRRALASADLVAEDLVSGTSDVVSSWRCKLLSSESESMIIGSFCLLLATGGLFWKIEIDKLKNRSEKFLPGPNFT